MTEDNLPSTHIINFVIRNVDFFWGQRKLMIDQAPHVVWATDGPETDQPLRGNVGELQCTVIALGDLKGLADLLRSGEFAACVIELESKCQDTQKIARQIREATRNHLFPIYLAVSIAVQEGGPRKAFLELPAKPLGTGAWSLDLKELLANLPRGQDIAQLRQSQKLEAIGILAGGVAHEINNPINGIMNYADIIRSGLDAESELAEFAGEIIHETERIATVVRNLLSFARLDSPTYSPASPREIVESTMTLIRTIMRQDQIDLRTVFANDLPLLECSSQQIQQVLLNLLTNARDALNEKHDGYAPEKIMQLTLSTVENEEGVWVRFVVEDQGSGISADVQERMFEPFFTTKAKGKGTGLGLAISRGIVRDHDGRLSCESTLGGPTRFYLDLPVAEAS